MSHVKLLTEDSDSDEHFC